MTTGTNNSLRQELDRLVDGELGPDAYKRLLRKLEEEPAGWRQCALAFLESQALQIDLPSAPSAGTAELPATPPTVVAHRPASWDGRLCFSVVASFLVAFLLGNQWSRRESNPPPGNSPVADVMIASNELAPLSQSSNGLPLDSVARNQEAGSATGNANFNPLGEMTLVMNDTSDRPREIELPVYDLTPENQQTLAEIPHGIPPQVADALKRSGFEVEQNLFWQPVDLGPSTRVMVPMGEVDIKPVALRHWQ